MVGVVRGFFDGVEVGSQAIGAGEVFDAAEELSVGAAGGDASVCLDEFSLLSFALSARTPLLPSSLNHNTADKLLAPGSPISP